MQGVSNLHSSLSNVISDKDLNKVLEETCDFIYDILKDHCGPLSEYAYLKEVTNVNDDGNFTKDGINIVRSLNFETPIQTSLKSAIAHIGSSVERAAADGTTSSMMLAIYTLKHLRQHQLIRKMPASWLTSAWKTIERELERMYHNPSENDPKDLVITLNSIIDQAAIPTTDLIERLAYSQTYTSSHGDISLANKVAELFKKVPMPAWKTIIVKRAEYETDKSYNVEIDTSEWSFNKIGIQPFQQRLTENLDGILYRTEEKTYICQSAPLLNGDVDSQELIKKISESIKNNEQVTYICSNKVDANSRNYLDTLYAENPSCKTTIIYIYPEKEGITSDLETFPMLIEGYNGEPIFEATFDYESNGKFFKITKGIHNFECNKDQLCYQHPWVGDKVNHKLYNEYIERLEGALDRAKKEYDQSTVNQNWYANIKAMYSKLTIINRVSFIIGGSLYNNLTAVDIVHDTLPAVRRILENGFCRGENKSLYIGLKNVADRAERILKGESNHNKPLTPEAKYRMEVIPFICRTIMKGIENLYEIVHQKSLKKDKNGFAKDFDPYLFEDAITETCYYLKDFGVDTDKPLVTQPLETDMEFIKRFGEMMIRFIKTNKMITIGTLISKEH